MRKRKQLLSMFMLTLVLFIVGCSNNAESSTNGEAKKGPTTVTFWHSMGGAAQEALNNIVEEYNSSQDKVKINAEYQGTYDEALTDRKSVV